MKVLVTGGTGYIGSHTVVELLNKGFEVVIADNLINSSAETLEGIAKITGKTPAFECIDLCNYESVVALFLKHQDISTIIHFAAYKAVGESVLDPLKYYSNNLESLINTLKAAAESAIKLEGFVFSSSCTVYGNPDELPVTESALIKTATSPYGNTKRICEDILQDLVKVANFRAISLRYFNPAGAHESALIGELPLGAPNNLVPIITQAAIGKRKGPIDVYGNDYSTPDGTCIRDYIHVVDLAKAHVVSIERLLKKKTKTNFEKFNVGAGIGYSVLQLIQMFETVSGLKLEYQIVARRPGDIESMYADTSYSNQELGWKAEKNLEQMIRSSWNWEKELAVKQKQA